MDNTAPVWGSVFMDRVDDDFSPAVLEALRPYVVNLTLGEFSNDGIMQTSQSDVDAIFDEHLPAFVHDQRRRGFVGPVPLVFWAHGGIVSESDGLTIAVNQVPWWLDNGAYPVHFVWETGFVDTVKQLFGWRRQRSPVAGEVAGEVAGDADGVIGSDVVIGADGGPGAAGATGGVDDAPDEQSGPAASRLWMAVKKSAALASGPDGGARYVGQRLAAFCAKYPGDVSLHAAGHSAGAIFHSHFIPTARAQGSPGFESLQLLAPALRVDGFRSQLLPLVGEDIHQLTVYTMNMQAENDDNCFQLYRRSLLYLVSRMFESESDAPILGLEQSIREDAELVAAFGLTAGVPGLAEVVWSPTAMDAPAHSRSSATSHGGFDNDSDTMNSVARRVLQRPEIIEYPADGKRHVHHREETVEKRVEVVAVEARTVTETATPQAGGTKTVVTHTITTATETTQIETTQIETAQIETAQIETAQIETAQIETAQIETAQIETAQILSPLETTSTVLTQKGESLAAADR